MSLDAAEEEMIGCHAIVELFRDCECDGGNLFLSVRAPDGRLGVINLSETKGTRTRKAILDWAESQLANPTDASQLNAQLIINELDQQIK